jgi:hypothetical protein
MTPDRSLDLDIRTDAMTLWHRTGVTPPGLLNVDGTASQDQTASIMPGTDLRRAALPHREVGADPAGWTGAAIPGSRAPDHSTLLAGMLIVGSEPRPDTSLASAASQQDILKRLLLEAGFQDAPSALWKLAGWQIGWVGAFLWRLKCGGTEGALIVAERQAACAIRQMWLALITTEDPPADLAASVGAVSVGRALVDMLTALEGLVEEAKAQHSLTPAGVDKAIQLQRLLTGILARYMGFVAKARLAQTDRGKATKMMGAFKAAKALADIIAMVTVGDEPLVQRVERALSTIPAGHRDPDALPVDVAVTLDHFNSQLSAFGGHPTLLVWRAKYLECLGRLRLPGRPDRMAAIRAVRTDLIFQLIATRRLDRLYHVLPWMMALSGAFHGIWGGPTGAVAQLFEAARAREIALELVRRLYDSDDPHRLDVRKGEFAYRDPDALVRQVADETRAGFRIAEHALSHDIAHAWLDGAAFHTLFPIEAASAGKLDWCINGGLADTQTGMTVHGVETGKPVYRTSSYEKDLPAYAGLPLIPMLGKAIVTIFRAEMRGPAFGDHMEEVARFDRKHLRRFAPHGMMQTPGAATRELMRSVFKSLDVEPPQDIDIWRTDNEVAAHRRARELRRFDRRLNAHTPNGEPADGGALRRSATDHDKAIGKPANAIWHLIDKARTWTPPKDGRPHPEDAPFERILEGQDPPPGLTPIAHHFLYPLWFRPDIDRHLLGWIARGASMTSPIAFADPRHGGLISVSVGRMRDRANPLYACAHVDHRAIDVAVILFTGFSNLMADDAHPRG